MDPEQLKYVLNKLREKPDENRVKFLTSRDWWSSIHTKFQKYLTNLVPATHLVSLPEGDTKDIKSILSGKGNLRVSKDDIILNKMNTNQCHENTATLFQQGKIKELHTGYALSDDGLWRQHSWGVDVNGKIIETTERLIYLTSFSLMNDL